MIAIFSYNKLIIIILIIKYAFMTAVHLLITCNVFLEHVVCVQWSKLASLKQLNLEFYERYISIPMVYSF